MLSLLMITVAEIHKSLIHYKIQTVLRGAKRYIQIRNRVLESHRIVLSTRISDTLHLNEQQTFNTLKQK